MLDYIYCNIQAHILYVINANYTILYYTILYYTILYYTILYYTILYVIYDNISMHIITQSFLFFFYEVISHELFSQFVVATIHFYLMIVYYLYTTFAKYIVFN